jgi:hypothetical protein
MGRPLVVSLTRSIANMGLEVKLAFTRKVSNLSTNNAIIFSLALSKIGSSILPKNIGGIYDAYGNLTLNKNHKYYFQVQGGMATTGTQVCDFVVYTLNTVYGCDGGIYVATIPFCKHFLDDVLSKVSRFYLTWMLPLIFEEITSTPCIAANFTPEVVKRETTQFNDQAPNATKLIQEELSCCSEAPTEVDEDEKTSCNDAVTTDSSPVKYAPDLSSSEPQKVLSSILGIPLFEDDLTCLLDNEKLNDTIVVQGQIQG